MANPGVGCAHLRRDKRQPSCVPSCGTVEDDGVRVGIRICTAI